MHDGTSWMRSLRLRAHARRLGWVATALLATGVRAIAEQDDGMWSANPDPWKVLAFVSFFSFLGGFWHMLWRWPAGGLRWQNALGGIGAGWTVGLIVSLIAYEQLKGTPTVLVGVALAFAIGGGELFWRLFQRWAEQIMPQPPPSNPDTTEHRP